MMRKLIAGLLILSFSCGVLFAETPKWVKLKKQGKSIENSIDYYFGVGLSKKSQKDADTQAYQMFAQSIETKVKTITKNQLTEKNGKNKEFTSAYQEVSTDMTMRGLSITQQYFDEISSTYYTLIKYKKTEYNKILEDEIKRDIERKETEFKSKKQAQLLEEEKQKEAIRKEKEAIKIKEKKDKLKAQKRTKLKKKYAKLFNIQHPDHVISLPNAQLIQTTSQVGAKYGINESTIEQAYGTFRMKLLQVSATSGFYDNKYNTQQFSAKLQILPPTGDFYKVAVSAGAVGYMNGLIDTSFSKADVDVAPMVSANVFIPNLYFSYITAYGDGHKFGLGLNSHLLYKVMEDRISFMAEGVYYSDKDLRNMRNEKLIFQAGIRFKTTQYVRSSITYENNDTFMFGLDFDL